MSKLKLRSVFIGIHHGRKCSWASMPYVFSSEGFSTGWAEKRRLNYRLTQRAPDCPSRIFGGAEFCVSSSEFTAVTVPQALVSQLVLAWVGMDGRTGSPPAKG